MATVTLEFLAAQQDRILAELAALRDDVRVTGAIVQRREEGGGGCTERGECRAPPPT